MTDKDKVFDAIRNCITEPKCRNCPWKECEKVGHKRVEVPVTLMLDALKLMKEQQEAITSFQGTIRKLSAALEEQAEQEPVKPKYTPKSIYSWECGVCNEPFDRTANYCPQCGRPVKWE